MKRRFIIPVIFCVFALQLAFAQRPDEKSFKDSIVLPGGKMGERIESIIDIFNSNDPERIRRFMRDECTPKFRDMAPMDEHIKVWLGVGRETGGIDFYGIRTYEPERKGETVVILRDRNFESWRGVSILFADEKEFLVDGLNISPARTPSGMIEAPLTEKELIQMVQDLGERLIARDIFSGTLLIAKGDEVLLTKVGGEASKSYHVPNNIDTKFNLGSMNKMFTATSIVQLAEKGLLNFQDPISKYVDESWLPKNITDKVTIHHLLTHTSGLGSYFNETYWKSSRELFRKVDDYKPLIKEEKLAFEPGTKFQYSNTGMFLLGVVIEKVTGQSYFDYVRKNIYEPAGMKNTDSYEMDYPVENLAIGYSPDWKSPYHWQNNLYKHVLKGGPAGGGFSTVGDLFKFARALQTGKLVKPESLSLMWKDYTGANYGYGFGVEEGPNGKVVGHSGGFDGINANLNIYLDKGYIVAVLSNYDMGASPVVNRIAQLLARVK